MIVKSKKIQIHPTQNAQGKRDSILLLKDNIVTSYTTELEFIWDYSIRHAIVMNYFDITISLSLEQFDAWGRCLCYYIDQKIFTHLDESLFHCSVNPQIYGEIISLKVYREQVYTLTTKAFLVYNTHLQLMTFSPCSVRVSSKMEIDMHTDKVVKFCESSIETIKRTSLEITSLFCFKKERNRGVKLLIRQNDFVFYDTNAVILLNKEPITIIAQYPVNGLTKVVSLNYSVYRQCCLYHNKGCVKLIPFSEVIKEINSIDKEKGAITKICKSFSDFICCFCIDNIIFVINKRSLISFTLE